MIQPSTILYIGAAAVIIYLLVKSFAKHFEKHYFKRQINKKNFYNTISAGEQLLQYEESQKLYFERLNNYYDQLCAGNDFINRNSTSLSQFVINNELNRYDLLKLAQLNGIRIEMNNGWYDLALDLMVELDGTGWNRKVTAIKEKFGEMRFNAETDREDLLDKYTEKSKTICEICGRLGNFYTVNSWDFTRCEQHKVLSIQ